MGGVGKTELALRVAYELKSEFSDGQLSFDLGGVSPHARTTAEAMAHVIRAFGATDESSAFPRSRSGRSKHSMTEAELEPRYQLVLRGKKAILLFDNAKDEAQIARLTPPKTCTMLVTSRQHLELHGLESKHLDVLPPSDAHELLLKVCGSIKGKDEEIAKLCGYLPLALWAAASTIKKSPNVTPADYTRHLKSYRARLDLTEPALNASIRAVMGLSYKLLGSEDQFRFRSLSVFPGEFDVEAAAAVWASQGRAAERALTTLLQYSVVEYDAAAGRYRLHDLMRDFAWEQLRKKSSERNTAKRRHAMHYLKLATTCNETYLKRGQHELQGLREFDADRANIEVGLDWAAKDHTHDGAVAKLFNDFILGADSLLETRCRADNRIRWGEAALAAVQHSAKQGPAQSEREGWYHDFLGFAYLENGDSAKARQHHQQQQKIAERIHSSVMKGHALNGLGIDAKDDGDTDGAIGFFTQAKRLFDKAAERSFSARLGLEHVLDNLGSAYMRKKDFARAAVFHDRALNIARKIKYRRGEAEDQWDLAKALYGSGNRSAAFQNAKEALGIIEELELSGEAAEIKNQLANWQTRK
jgi:tetratricopeptide (TPR) repeat protein